jgi:hypothetical protein
MSDTRASLDAIIDTLAAWGAAGRVILLRLLRNNRKKQKVHELEEGRKWAYTFGGPSWTHWQPGVQQAWLCNQQEVNMPF